MLKNLLFTNCLFPILDSVFPERAAIGEILEASFAGFCAAIKTLASPTRTPARIPVTLIVKIGMLENSSPTIYLSPPQRIQVETTPINVPIGIAVLHQFSDSNLTNFLI